MSMFNWCGFDWIKQERWGQIHKEKTNWWYDPDCVELDSTGNLVLSIKNNPKYFKELNITSDNGVGLVSCLEKFGHGIFSIEAKLPNGKNLWPAFWMWSWDSWPPEIDIFEGYSNDNENFFKFRILKPLAFWNLQTNVHFNKGGINKMIGGKTHFFGFKDPTQNFIKYSLDWNKNYLKFYYDGRLVRKVTDKRILEQLSKTTMNVVINNGITNEYLNGNKIESDFIIKNFQYVPY